MTDHPAAGCLGIASTIAASAALLYFGHAALGLLTWIGGCTVAILAAVDRLNSQHRDDARAYNEMQERRHSEVMTALQKIYDRSVPR